MRPFSCPVCRRFNHFESAQCPGCGSALAYDPARDAVLALSPDGTTWCRAGGEPTDLQTCANGRTHGLCNWLTTADAPGGLCRACRHNQVIPDLTVEGVADRWARIEAAKRRLFHSLIRLGLPLETVDEAPAGVNGLRFDFLYDPQAETGGEARVMTGHDDGLITLNLVEADDAARERIRVGLGEPYRTLVGHFRHEVGHHYWSRLVAPDPQALAAFRALFGDERRDYGEALADHYARAQNGGADDEAWEADHVSFYATSHPWEDFAETFAHFCHIVDLLATARGFGLRLASFPASPDDAPVAVDFDPYTAPADALAEQMAPLSFAMNDLARSLGQADPYPFALRDGVVAKLDHIAQLVARTQ